MPWKMKSTKSWVAKLRPDLEPKIVRSKRTGERMLVPTPLLVAEEIRKVRKGRLTTPKRLRTGLARRTGAESACPMTTGILLSIVAGAAEEQLAEGKRPVAPYWRVVEDDGSLRAKNPAGPSIQARRLRAEGHRVRKQSGREQWKVEGFA
ncbi:MAG: MGMT family protein [Acidobacteriota bacterium]|nr:MGMT family protein [Acidobacteriota bacterium]